MRPPRVRRSPVAFLVASIGGGLLLVLVVVAWWSPSPPVSTPGFVPVGVPSGGPRNVTELPTLSIVPAGVTYQMPAGAFEDVIFDLPLAGHLHGGFTSTGPALVAVMTTSTFVAFESGHGLNGTTAASGGGTAGALDLTLPAGTWYLVFDPEGSDAPTSVTVTMPFEAAFPSSGA